MEFKILNNNNTSVHKEVWFIHGANATPSSFNYIKDNLAKDPELNNYLFKDITYDCQDGISDIVSIMIKKAPSKVPLYIVGHSLGGVLAAIMAQEFFSIRSDIDLRGILTFSSPFGGSESANYLKWLYPKYNLFKNISTSNGWVKKLKEYSGPVPITSLVTSSGNNPLFPTSNDGVVTISSQRALKGAKYIELPSNHFEVLVNPNTIKYTKEFLKNN